MQNRSDSSQRLVLTVNSVIFVCSLCLSKTSFAEGLYQAISSSEARQSASLVPRSQLAQGQLVTNESLSPDGRYMSYIKGKAKHSELWLLDIDKNQHRQLFSSKDMDVAYWSTDSGFLFVQNKKGLTGISIEPDAFALLISDIDESVDQYFYGVDSHHKQAVIFSEKDLKKQIHQLVRITAQGIKNVLFTSNKRVLDYLLDDKGQVSFIRQQSKQGSDLFDVRAGANRLIKHCEWFDYCSLQTFNSAENSLLVKARFEQDLDSLFAIGLLNLKTELLHQDPKGLFDLSKVYYDKHDQPRLTLYQDKFISQYALDIATEQQLDKLVNKLAPFTTVNTMWIFKPSNNFKVWLALDMSSNKSQHKTYLFNQITDQLTQPLEQIYTESKINQQQINQEYLVAKIAINYTASDGMQQFGYLSLPLGKKLSQVPLVVKPHGGPWSRVTGSYDPITQLLANRGFAVFEPNFRASTGMGINYVLSAEQDFGDGRVQQDIIDGMNYVLSIGVGDRDKLAIHGHSFGGFSTITALAFTPDLFKVGIAGAPPSDIAQSVKALSQKAQNDSQLVGQLTVNNLALDPNDPAAMQRFYQKSPDAHWQNITQPLYILAGGQDPKVSVARIKDFSIRLKQANKPISLLVDEKEGHSPKSDIAREAYMYVLEKALATHLSTDYQQEISVNLRRYLERNMLIDNNGLLFPKK
jgi:dipeptidyl aminopeptidase/acylaminoacyl peptidase